MKSRPILLRLLRQRQLAIRPSFALVREPLFPGSAQNLRLLSTSIRRLQEKSQSSTGTGNGHSGSSGPSGSSASGSSSTGAGPDQDQKRHSQNQSSSSSSGESAGTAPVRNPLRVFLDVLKEEIRSSEEFQMTAKQLQGDAKNFTDSQAIKKGKAFYEAAKINNIIKSSPRLRAAAKTLQDSGVSLQSAVGRAMNDSGVLDAIAKASGVVNRLTQPIRDTEMYKALEDGIGEMVDDIEMSGYEDKAQRRARRARRLERARKAGLQTKRVKANTEAGQAVVLSDKQESPASTSRISSMLSSSPAYQRFLENYYESDAPFYSALRSVGSRAGRLFDENEHAKVVRRIRQMDPDFRLEKWVTELREYIIPEIVDAYLGGDVDTLQEWMTEAAFSVAQAQVAQYSKLDLTMVGQVLEIRDVDVAQAKFREDDTTPTFLVSFGTDERTIFRHAKTGEILSRDPKTGQVVEGASNSADRARYVVAFTREEEGLDNEVTGGWRVMEMVRAGGAAR